MKLITRQELSQETGLSVWTLWRIRKRLSAFEVFISPRVIRYKVAVIEFICNLKR